MQSLADNALFNRSLFGAWYITLSKTMTIFHFGWTGGVIVPWKIQPLLVRFFFIPILALLGFIVGKKDKRLPFFALLGVLGIFLAKQNTPPFPDIYQWLFDHVPGFNAFRESGKFLLYVAISYSVLIGAFISWFWDKSELKINRSLKILTVFLIAFLIIWNSKPIITGELGALFVQRKIPNDYLILNEYLTAQKEYFRTFWTPDYSRWGHYLSIHPRTSVLYLNLFEWLDFAKKGNPIGSIYFNQLLDLSSIRYVIVPIQDKSNDDDFFPQTNKRINFISELERLPYLKKINVGFKELVMFENFNYRPHIYSTQKKERIYSYVPYQKIKYSMVNPTQYKIILKNVKEAVYLNFSENYNPNWKIRVGKFSWFATLTGKNYFLSDDIHFKNEAKLNSFIIDVQQICKKQDACISNSDGSYDINLTVYFSPQSYLYIGLIISAVAFFTCIGYLIITLIKIGLKTNYLVT
ncbi:hypothetical protein HY357_04755 [Candidatus Roizmanbacteria bacterium]|nr:hypothetical protein [Candidatus Roizmanbacteria bacterium]